jgi:hypothetical protein
MARSFNQGQGRFIPTGVPFRAMFAGAALLAHQGGWDEFLLVALPIVLIIAVLVVVKRRVDRMS